MLLSTSHQEAKHRSESRSHRAERVGPAIQQAHGLQADDHAGQHERRQRQVLVQQLHASRSQLLLFAACPYLRCHVPSTG